jgi:hypothetical protein
MQYQQRSQNKMSQSRKHRGYRTEKVVAEYLSQWWSHAIANGAGRAGNDVTGIPFNLEIKARSSFQPKAWIDQVTKRSQSDGNSLPVVVCRLNGQGEVPGNYLAFMRLSDLVGLLLAAGYADLQSNVGELIPERCDQCGAWRFKDVPCRTCEKASSNADL